MSDRRPSLEARTALGSDPRGRLVITCPGTMQPMLYHLTGREYQEAIGLEPGGRPGLSLR